MDDKLDVKAGAVLLRAALDALDGRVMAIDGARRRHASLCVALRLVVVEHRAAATKDKPSLVPLGAQVAEGPAVLGLAARLLEEPALLCTRWWGSTQQSAFARTTRSKTA